jgi:hypothetical protein
MHTPSLRAFLKSHLLIMNSLNIEAIGEHATDLIIFRAWYLQMTNYHFAQAPEDARHVITFDYNQFLRRFFDAYGSG